MRKLKKKKKKKKKKNFLETLSESLSGIDPNSGKVLLGDFNINFSTS